ncbi:MAG: helix-turn-helix domain-containing protein [Gemmatimonadota bacterium]|jgi:transposase|nr:helix-turn-helix domain-containing protein [Gemmatimonadota bacterium]
MNQPLYVRALTAEERRALEAGLRSSDAFTLRRSQILLASAAGKRASQIGRDLHVDTDTALGAIRAFNEHGLAALVRRSSRPETLHFVLPPEHADALKAILHQSPREFGKEASRWTLDLLAEVAAEQGLATHKMTPEGMRQVLLRAGIRWQRAKEWIHSPDPAYARKKAHGTD